MSLNSNINKVTLLGEIFSDPVHRTTKNMRNIVSFKVKTASDQYKDKLTGETKQMFEIHNVVVMLEQVIVSLPHEVMTKGNNVYVEGMLKHRKWKANDSGSYGNIDAEEKVGSEILISNFFHKVIVLSDPQGSFRDDDSYNDGNTQKESMKPARLGSMKDNLDDEIPF